MTAAARAARAWDAAAPRYDADVAAGVAHARLRGRGLGFVRGFVAPPMRVLEIGCGTGSDALELAAAGLRVTAIDASPGMIAEARRKAAAHRAGGLVTFRVLAAEDVGRFARGAFDAAYSLMGPLNCVPRLASFARALAGVLRPGGVFVSSIMNRLCLAEVVWGMAQGDPGAAIRRLGPNPRRVAPSPGGPRIAVWYRTPGELMSAFRPGFHPRTVTALGSITPPPSMDAFCGRHPRVFRRLARLDDLLGDTFPWRVLGDHTLIAMQRGRHGT